ncbi:MAG: outer membrane receptor for ferrienterochelin and colicins [Flavobacteriales bacterium]|jgi:outer membrane receptor for ferrienterochelin and colicins
MATKVKNMMTMTKMKSTKFLFVLCALFFSITLIAQSDKAPKFVKGKVLVPRGVGHDEKDPLIGANVYWKGTQVGTMTDASGFYKIETENASDTLVFSFIGYTTGYVLWKGQEWVEVILESGKLLKEAEVVVETNTTRMQMLNPLEFQTLDQRELTKAACCNLSESFETNASIDAAYTDAVSGTRQIKMLGLDGKYVDMNKDNIPTIRGLSTVYGLGYVPGPWINQISISKGVGSVTSGYESITGQINIAIKNPIEAEKYYFNFYGNNAGRLELNTHTRQNLGRKWATTVMVHANMNNVEMDNNKDGFMDNALKEMVILRNEWKYQGDRGVEGSYQFTAMHSNTEAGQLSSIDPNTIEGDLWKAASTTTHVEASAKTGYVWPGKLYKSLGTQLSGEYHDQVSTFGQRQYKGIQQSARANVLYASIIGTTDHTFTIGASVLYDDYDESLDSLNYTRTEIVPGVYGEYSWSRLERFTLVTGMRIDANNLYGIFWTPRAHFRYSFSENTSIKFMAGKGYRTSNVIMENVGQLASNRTWIIQAEDGVDGFGLQPEVAWNFGTNLMHNFRLNYRDASISFDFYRTEFENQVVTDLENPREVRFYNLEGRSFSNSAQAEFSWSPARRWDLRMAYRWLQVQTDYTSERLDVPLVSTHRAFTNVSYETKKNEKSSQWKFDVTIQWVGDARLPSTEANPEEYQVAARSDDYFLLSGQITKVFTERFEVYLGGENLLNYRQPNAILAAEDPNGEYFDASLVWAPVFGAMAYGGIRWNVK